MLGQISLWLLVALPALVGAVLLMLAPVREARWAPAVGIGTAAAAAVLAVVVAATRPSVGVPFVAGARLGLRVDGLAGVVAPAVALVTVLVLLAAAVDVREAPARFHGFMLLFAAAVLVTVTATSFPALLLGWEIMGATSYALIGFRWREAHRVTSGLTAFLVTRSADLGLYLAAAAALVGAGSLRLGAAASATPGWRDAIAAGVLVAALGKAAQLVFAFWIARAMDGPSPVSALLHSAAMVAMGGYLLLRVSPLLLATSWAGPATAWAGALTAVALGAVAVGQSDLKLLLAASTSAQLGFVVMAAGLGATPAGTAQLVAHAATKAALFLAAGAWLSALGTKSLAGLRGTVGDWPLVRVAASAALLSLAGVPPLSLWASKDAVLAAALHRSVPLYLVGLLGAALSAAYAGTVLRVLWAPADADERRTARAHHGEEEIASGRVPTLLTASVVVLAAAAVVLGVLALPPVARALASAVGGVLVEPSALELAVSTLVSVGVVVLAWRRPLPRPAWARDWLGLEATAHAVVVRPALGLARGLARADDVLGAALDASGRGTLALASWASTADDRWVDGAVRGLAGGVRRLAASARRPQTGMLHQYYVQAVALVALGAVLVLLVR
ncbi:MAG TPA: proton-conducting transporter membrane subunit [Propionibacteriaceae bacterium]|nr:proton-conducting transporter membrane subunit [Propionibacteriaceae bacterium]